VHRVTQEMATIFEAYIQRDPTQWHMMQPNWPSDGLPEPPPVTEPPPATEQPPATERPPATGEPANLQ
jgi:hypothetical protein